jgi:hypothetical protein
VCRQVDGHRVGIRPGESLRDLPQGHAVSVKDGEGATLSRDVELVQRQVVCEDVGGSPTVCVAVVLPERRCSSM